MAHNRKKRLGTGNGPWPDDVQEVEGRDARSRPFGTSRGAASMQVAYEELSVRKGPIPDAEELARYGLAHPEAPRMILDEFRQQGTHRRDFQRKEQRLDARALEAEIFSERLGVVCALIIALVGFGCATYLVATDHGISGTVIFGLDVGALVTAFILGRPRLTPDRG